MNLSCQSCFSVFVRAIRWQIVGAFFLIYHTESAYAETITFDDYTMLARERTSGLYNLIGLGTWNGQPLSPTNMPNNSQRLLESTVTFWAKSSVTNIMFVQVSDIITTQGAFWFGTAFNNVTQTGIRLNLPTALANDTILFSSTFANPGQVRAYGGSSETIEPLTTTPGYAFERLDTQNFLISTTDGAENGFTSLGQIRGASRIRGGGVFQLTFSPSANVFTENFSNPSIASEYGFGNQYIGDPLAAGSALVPETSGLMQFLPALLPLSLLAVSRRRKK